MDKWKDVELEKMKVGGNWKAHEFFESQPDYNKSMSLLDKYNSKAAALYRDKVISMHTTKNGSYCWTSSFRSQDFWALSWQVSVISLPFHRSC